MAAMDHVRVGMQVVDSAGEGVGTVEELKAGDPEAVTAEGQQLDEGGGLIGELARTVGTGPKLPPETASRLLRVGYIRIDRDGLMSGHVYAAADRIDDVVDDTVRLNVTANELPKG